MNNAVAHSITDDDFHLLEQSEQLTVYKEFIKSEKERIKLSRRDAESSKEVCKNIAHVFNTIIEKIYQSCLAKFPETSDLALVANGGFGRGLMHPGSDIDLLFLLPKSSDRLTKQQREAVDSMLYPLWDLNVKIGHAVRGVNECIQAGKTDPITRTTLMDSRFIIGNEDLFNTLKKKFRKAAIESDQKVFFEERKRDMDARFKRYSETVFLQEPNVKESPGGLRDFHNILWICDILTGERDLSKLAEQNVISEEGLEQLKDAVDFLRTLRNEMHFITKKTTDVLSLRLQGEVAESLEYPGEDILIKIEKLMREYYTHARNLNTCVNGAFETLQIELEAFKANQFPSWLPFNGKLKKSTQQFDGFYVSDGFLYANDDEIFIKKPSLILKAYRHCQKNRIRLSPSLRRLIKSNRQLIDRTFNYSKVNRDIFEEILETKGLVGRCLRMMHRCGILGAYVPEFGTLDCLVQHEFFHRYTADEHTLRTIDILDSLAHSDDPKKKVYHKLFKKFPDPYALYLSLLLHDTGRSLNTDDHVDGSSEFAQSVCNRLQVTVERRKLIMFLVEHHLTLWNFATKKDIDDPEVIQEFATFMKSAERLDALFIFTYCDSGGTNPDGWGGWKELAITNLYRRARQVLSRSTEEEEKYHQELRDELKVILKKKLNVKFHDSLENHFKQMPEAYFRYRDWRSISSHIRAIWEYYDRRIRRPDTPFEAALKWNKTSDENITELMVVSSDKPALLATICCALAKYRINILSAQAYTRSDGTVIDVFKIEKEDGGAVNDRILQLQVVQTIYEINQQDDYDPGKYITSCVNIFKQNDEVGFEPRAIIDNQESAQFSVIEVMAKDRIGLLHDLLTLFEEHGLITDSARIATEWDTAIDTFHVTTEDGDKLDIDEAAKLHPEILKLASK